MDFVLERLAVGDRFDAAAPDARIGAFLCVAEELEPPAHAALRHKIPLVDMAPIPPARLAEAVDWIARHIARERVLVYCHYGIARSVSVTIAYLCCAEDYDYHTAVDHLTRLRPQIYPLPGLAGTIAQLRGQRSTIEKRR